MTKRGSGLQRANDHVAAFELYLQGLKERGLQLPTRTSGEVNLTKIAEESGVGDRGRFHTNEKLKLLLDGAKATLLATPIAHVDEDVKSSVQNIEARSGSPEALERAQRHAHRLEQMNASLIAENADLRKLVKNLRLQLGREDMIIETGRRVPPPVLK